jgi:putative transposase
VMCVTRSCYYSYCRRKGIQKESELTEKVKECFGHNRRRYGSRRIAIELKISRETARRLMIAEQLRAIQRKRFRPKTTDSDHDLRISPNLLKTIEKGSFTKGEVIVGDITYLPIRGGKFCYFACFQDKCTRRIVGWQVSQRMTTQLVIDALNMARRRFLIKPNAIIHTDRGSQYASVEYRRLLYINGFRQSMSRKGNCYDNAQAESFFSRFKAELLEEGIFESVEDAKSEVFSYIEGYYNRTRIHSALGKSPLEFEKELKIKERRERVVSC